jgi:hypothetical protein
MVVVGVCNQNHICLGQLLVASIAHHGVYIDCATLKLDSNRGVGKEGQF